VHQKLDVAHRGVIEKTDPSTIAEVSGLVKEPGESSVAVYMLYRAMWQYSLTKNIRLWLMSSDERLYNRLTAVFGDKITRIGPGGYFKGHQVVPVMLDIQGSLDRLLVLGSRRHIIQRNLQRYLIKFFLRGLPARVITDSHHQMLKSARVDARILSDE
jgi:N-acyl-L-homoserine lactone synthetase